MFYTLDWLISFFHVLKIFGLQAEALLKTNKHDDAIETMKNCPNFGVDECTRIFGPRGSASILVHRSQVDLVAGRLELNHSPFKVMGEICIGLMGEY